MRNHARQRFCSRLIALAVLLAPALASAEAFPSKPIHAIVPWPAGGNSDRAMRLVADAAGRYLGVPLVVVNKPGAGGALGTRDLAKADADGYTIGILGIGVLARQYTSPNSPPVSALQPIVFLGAHAAALTVRADSRWKTLADYVKAAKAEPGTIKNANDPPGGFSYLAIAVIERQLGIKLNRVPYKGYAPEVAALLAGEVDSTSVPLPSVIEHHKAGKLRILGVASDKRHFLGPDIPTFKEQGFEAAAASWLTLAAPAGVPADRLKVLEAKLLQALNDPAYRERARKAGYAVEPMGTRDTEARWRGDEQTLYPVLRDAGLVKVDPKK